MIYDKELLMEQNLQLAEEHLSCLLAYPDLLDRIPDDSYVILLPTDNEELFEANLHIANELARKLSEDRSPKSVVMILQPVASGNQQPVPA